MSGNSPLRALLCLSPLLLLGGCAVPPGLRYADRNLKIADVEVVTSPGKVTVVPFNTPCLWKVGTSVCVERVGRIDLRRIGPTEMWIKRTYAVSVPIKQNTNWGNNVYMRLRETDGNRKWLRVIFVEAARTVM